MSDERVAVAVVGLAAAFGGARDLEELWVALMTGDRLSRSIRAARETIVAAALADAGHDGPAAFDGARLTEFHAPDTSAHGAVTAIRAACAALGSRRCDVAVVACGDAEGACAVVLRRYAEATADHDDVRALLGGAPSPPGGADPVRFEPPPGTTGGCASALAALVAAVLALDREVAPPGGPGGAPVAWPRTPDRRRAATVLGGITAEEGPARQAPIPVGRPRVLVWSGASASEERAVRGGLAQFFVRRGEEAFDDAAGTLQLARGAGAFRAAAVCTGALDAAAVLGAVDSDRVLTGRDLVPAPRTDVRAGELAQLTAAARRWVAGHDVDWRVLGQAPPARRIPLLPAPTPWTRPGSPATSAARPAHPGGPTAPAHRWIETLHGTEPGPTLVALPYAGGSGRAFRALRGVLPPECALALVDLPGHGNLMTEPCLDDVDDIVAGLVEAVSVLDRPILLGYSLGGSLAREVAARLCAAGRPPAGLVVCGTRAPQTGVGHPPIAHAAAGVPFLGAAVGMRLAAPEMLEYPDLAATFSAPLHTDLAMVESFPFRPGPQLDIPSCVIGFRSDWLVPEPALRAWDDWFAEPPLHLRVDGGHLALHEPDNRFGAAVTAAVEHVRTAADDRPRHPLAIRSTDR